MSAILPGTDSPMMVWVVFALLTAIISFSAYKLSIYADKIAEETGLGRHLVGLIMLSAVTSLPELITGFSSVRIVKNPDLAVGDIMGSCVFNLMIVFLLDLLHKEGDSVYKKSTPGHIITAALGMIMLSFLGLSFAVARYPVFQSSAFGYSSLIIPILYVLCLRESYQYEKQLQKNHASKARAPVKKTVFYFSLNAIIIIIAGGILPYIGDTIVEMMGWNSAFVGTVFIALATSLPELGITISSVRIHAIELAFSNLLGSNIFNIIILAIDDFFYTTGPLLAAVSAGHLVTLFSALMMTGLIIVALVKPPEKKLLNSVSTISLLLLAIFIGNLTLSFLGYGESH